MREPRTADWYFDYISPFGYLSLTRFDTLPGDLVIRPVPIVFAGLLKHWGHKGPAEIPPKRLQTFRQVRWLAEQHGIPLAMPPAHPFNPLALLRLTIAAGSTLQVVRTTYAHVWAEGNAGDSEDSITRLAAKLGITDPQTRISDAAVKATLIANGEQALAHGVYGVPTFHIDGELFWGMDALPMMAGFLKNPDHHREPLPFE